MSSHLISNRVPASAMLVVSSPSPDAKTHIIDCETGVNHRQLKSDPCVASQSMAYCESTNMLAVSQEKNCIFLFDPTAQRPLQKCFMPERIAALSISSCGKMMVGGGKSGCAYLWLLASGELVQIAKGHLRPLRYVAFNPQATMYCTGSEDGTCRVWLTKSEEEVVSSLSTFTGHTLTVTACEFFRWRSWVATVSSDRTARVFDAAHGIQLFSAQLQAPATSLLLFEDDRHMVVGGTQGMLHFVNLYSSCSGPESLDASQDRVVTLPGFSHGHEQEIIFIQALKVDRLITLSKDGVCLVWGQNPQSGSWQVLHELWAQRQGVCSATFIKFKGIPTTLDTLKERPSSGPLLSKFPTLPDGAFPQYQVQARITASTGEKRPRESDLDDEDGSVVTVSKKEKLQSRRDQLLALANSLYQKLEAQSSA